MQTVICEFLLTLYFISEYTQLMNSAVKAPGKQRRDSAIHGHVSTLPSHPAATRHGVGFCAIRQVLAGYPF